MDKEYTYEPKVEDISRAFAQMVDAELDPLIDSMLRGLKSYFAPYEERGTPEKPWWENAPAAPNWFDGDK